MCMTLELGCPISKSNAVDRQQLVLHLLYLTRFHFVQLYIEFIRALDLYIMYKNNAKIMHHIQAINNY